MLPLNRESMEFVITQDGSPTIYDVKTGEHHHSLIGAYTEGFHKFAEVAKPVLEMKEKVRILDLPFGLGYNLIATLDLINSADWTGKCKPFIECVAIEKDPAILLAIDDLLQNPSTSSELKVSFSVLSELSKGERQISKNGFSLECIVDDLLVTLPLLASSEKQKFDLIYFDSFSPRVLPALWSRDNVLKYFYELISDNGLLITYSASNKVRKGLLDLGFNIAPSVSVGRKMPGTIASKSKLQGIFSEETQSKIMKSQSY